MFKKLRSDIACILERDPAARTRWEVLTCYPGLHAIYIHKLAHWFWLHGLRWLGRLHVAPRPLADRHRDPSRREDRLLRVHRPRHGRGDRRDRRGRRRLHHLPGRDARRHVALPRREAPSDARRGRGGRRRRQGARRLHRRRRRAHRLERGGGEGSARRRDRGRHSRPHRRRAATPKQAERFAAYAVVQEQDDPYAKAIQKLVEHSQELEQALASAQREARRGSRKTSRKNSLGQSSNS